MGTQDQANMPNEEMNTQTEEQQEEQKTPETFTQEDVNRIIQKRVAKYSDYEELKAKAAKLDEMEEANKSELQKAQERAGQLQAELDKLNKAEELRTIRNEVAEASGVPAGLLTGTTKEECEEQAEKILNFAKPDGYPKVKDAGEVSGKLKKETRDQFAEWMENQK